MSRLSGLLGTAVVLTFIGSTGSGQSTTTVTASEQACAALVLANFANIPDAPTQITEAVAAKASEALPGYCKVTGYVAPQVGIKIGLPGSWNGKFIEMGCASYCGYLDLGVCDVALRRGYACIVSDMGHETGYARALWAYNNLQTKMDFGHRSAHVTAIAGKALVEHYYRRPPDKSYFIGGSMGGRQALQEAQRFPEDFDGIVAINAPVDLSKLFLTAAWGFRVLRDGTGKPLLGKDELKWLTDAAVAKCDLDDGVKDGVIGDPMHCAFDPGQLACTPSRMSACLSPAQVEAVKKVYAGPLNSRGARLTHGGPLVGSELGQVGQDLSGWKFAYIGFDDGELAKYNEFAADAFRYLLFWPDAGSNWKLSDLDFDRDIQRTEMMGAFYDSSNPDLRPFKAAGGKLLIFQGLNDTKVMPRDIIDYYQTAERVVGGRAEMESFARLFLLPGVGHFFDGPGAATVDYLSALDAWVDRNQPPDKLIAAHLQGAPASLPSFPLDPMQVQFTRPLYPYPMMARYTGRGDPNNAANFVPIHREAETQ